MSSGVCPLLCPSVENLVPPNDIGIQNPQAPGGPGALKPYFPLATIAGYAELARTVLIGRSVPSGIDFV